jgi:hypothetical protein
MVKGGGGEARLGTGQCAVNSGGAAENADFTGWQDFDKERAMPRRAGLDTAGTLHPVMIRGIEGEATFRDNRDRKDYVSRLGKPGRETGGAAGLPLFVRRLLTG